MILHLINYLEESGKKQRAEASQLNLKEIYSRGVPKQNFKKQKAKVNLRSERRNIKKGEILKKLN